ncbi:MAG: protein kinase [Elusimicrobia bacterium]|nr:protein kinase [Elusimicrobiota bacterium]
MNSNGPSAAIALGQSALAAGDLPTALADANQAVQAGGGVSALDLRGDVEFKMNQFSNASADAQAALKLNPQDADAASLLHFTADRVDGTAASDGGGPARGAGSRGAMNRPGAGAQDGNSALAASAAAGAARVAAEEAAGKARAALGLGDGEAASAAIEKGLAADPGNPVLLGLRAQIEARKGQWAKSLADAEAALAKDPKNIALLRAKALAQLRTKDYAGAIATANEMLELDPNNADAFAIRGQAYGLLGKYDMMTADLQSAAALDPYYKDIAARAKAGTLVAPADSDVLFLLPGEGNGGAGFASAPAGRARRFGWMLALAAAGGLLMALGLLGTVLAPARRRAAEALARLTRTGPTVGALPESEPAAVASPVAGLIRGQYELSREIGVGGMGRVYEGTDRSLGRRVAIKKMRDELRADPRERMRFVAEAKTVAALHHPNIVDIYAIAEEGADVYLVFEYIDGKTAHDLVYERGRLEPAVAASVARACAEALEFAHSRGVIHRDMKPSNVMIDAAGRVKVMDFGIARAAKDALARGTMTNTVIGTPPYMAPEQEQGQVRRESDVYALAICTYEMLVGELPFSGVGMGMSLNKLNMAYEPATKRVPGLPAAVDAAFARAFQPDPGKRWSSPREFVTALDAALTSPAAARA